MVKLNNLLTFFCASSLFAITNAKQYEFEGECIDLSNSFGEKFSIEDCSIDENGKMISLDISSGGDILTQDDIEIISNYSNLQELEFTRFGNFTNVNFESLNIPSIIFYDLKKLLHSKQSKFRNNVFTPEVLKTVKNVNTLELRGYKITQTTLDALSTLTNVKEIILSSSGFDENLDFSILKKAKSLTNLNIDYYKKSNLPLEKFPDSICKIKQLKKLEFHCEITSIPSCINNLKKLEYIDFYENSITEIPDEIGDFSKLKYLNIDYNRISNFTSAICNLSKLETLDLGSNLITEIPSCIQNLSKLKILDLSSNDIETIPKSFYNLKKLENMDLSFNKILKLSSNIKNLKNLKTMDVFANSITAIPDNISKLVNLEILNFGSNEITVIPDSIKKLVNLKQLTISDNKITVIPEIIGNLVNLEILNLSDNKIVDLPEFLGNLTALKELDLSFNDIDATIPESYNNLEDLTKIRLDGNESIKGKTLTNPKLETCYYSYGNGVCKSENTVCTVYPNTVQNC